jgi:hypothetical protein
MERGGWYLLINISVSLTNSQVLVAQACNPSYLGGDRENCGLRPAQAKSETLVPK